MEFLASLRTGQWLELAFALHAVALAVVNMTPTPKDDTWVAKGYRVLEIAAGLLSARVKM